MVGVSRESGVHRIVVDNGRLCLVSDAGEYLIKKRKGCFTINLRQHIGIQNMKIIYFFLFLVVTFSLLDPDPYQINADPDPQPCPGHQRIETRLASLVSRPPAHEYETHHRKESNMKKVERNLE
jgi:hypothetical protein